MAVAMLSGFLLMFPTRRRGLRAALFCFLLCAAGLGLACGGGGGGSSGGGGGSGGSTPVPTSLAIQTSNAKVPALTAGTFTLSATVTSTQPVTGNVTFVCAAAGVSSGPIPVVNSGASFLSNWSNTAGTYAITAMYSGDSNNQASQSATPLNEVFTGGTSVVYSAQTGGVSHNFSVLVTLQ
jgi:Big-like domain-containing protein